MTRLARTDHPIHELLQKRWSPRAFADRLVEPAKLASLLEAARWAPSSFNGQPWSFIVATKDNSAEFSKLLSCLIEFNQSWAKAAPVLMLTVTRLTFEHNNEPNRHAFHDVGLAMGNLSVQATSEGLFLHQMAGILPDVAKKTFGIPDGFEAVAGVALGYLGDPATLPEKLRDREAKPSDRKPLSAFVFSGTWGQAAGVLSRKS
jgi:nitroreductase